MIAAGSAYGTITDVPTLRIAQDDAADELLGRDPLALLIGMLLDQHMRQRSSDDNRGPRAQRGAATGLLMSDRAAADLYASN
jgi:hypothetical protein